MNQDVDLVGRRLAINNEATSDNGTSRLLPDRSVKDSRLFGLDRKEGWLSTTKGKTFLYDACTEAFREQETCLHSFATFCQLASIEGTSLRAPDGEPDDRADSYALAVRGVLKDSGPMAVPITLKSRPTRDAWLHPGSGLTL